MHESLADAEDLPPPDTIAVEIVENPEVALKPFCSIYKELAGND